MNIYDSPFLASGRFNIISNYSTVQKSMQIETVTNYEYFKKKDFDYTSFEIQTKLK